MMKKIAILSLYLLGYCSTFAQVNLSKYDVIYKGQSYNQMGSMPIGNGDIGANVWVDSAGLMHILISKTDAQSEIGRLLKIGEVQLQMIPNILSGHDFTQKLIVQNGYIEIESRQQNKTVKIRCYVDANHPNIHILGNSNFPIKIKLKNAIWRTKSTPLIGDERHGGYGVAFRPEPFFKEVDTVLTQKNALLWAHQNMSSIWQMTLDNQNISDFNKIGKDPLKHQIFGAIATGDQFTQTDDLNLEQPKASKQFNINISVLKLQTSNLKDWIKKISVIHNSIKSESNSVKINSHIKWWNTFWNQHYILIHSKQDSANAFKVTQGYLLQRYINACAGRGSLPIKFNGSIFTVAPDSTLKKGGSKMDADFRLWGGNYWFQNTRLIYNSMFYTGDFNFFTPFFNMYTDALPLAKFRTKKYFNHNGAYFTETLTPWGSYLIDNYGWERKNLQDGVSENKYIRYYWQSGIELCSMMLDYFEFTNDTAILLNKFIPFINEIAIFYNSHYKRDELGKIKFEPAQSLETYFEGMSNPLPEIAGLKFMLGRLIKLKKVKIDAELVKLSNIILSDLPDIPTTKINNKEVLSPGSNLGTRMNVEKPELYAVFPYRIFGVDKPKLELALETYHQKANNEFWGWQQDAIDAAYLGLTDEAKKMVVSNFSTKHSGSRFPTFWGPNYDWVPDQDHGNVTMRALQNMLVQSENDKILLFPAWPKEWDVQFKINVQGNQKIEGSYSQAKGAFIKKHKLTIPIKNMMD